MLEERQLDTGIIHYGDMARVRSFMHKLLNKQPVHIGESPPPPFYPVRVS